MLVVLIGFGWAKRGNSMDSASLTPFITNISVPCLAFHSLATMHVPMASLGATALAAAILLTVTLALAAGALKLAKLRLRTYLPALSFPNAGNLGLSLSLSAFGQPGLTYAMISFVIFSIANNTLGRSIAAGEGNWLTALKAPIVPAIALGVASAAFGVAPPEWIMKSLEMIGSLGVPLMLVMLGASLATIQLRSFRRGFVLSLARLFGGAAIGFAVATAFGFVGPQRATLVLQSAMPAAVINYMYAQLWKSEPDEVASVVVISTLLSIGTTPLLLALLLRL